MRTKFVANQQLLNSVTIFLMIVVGAAIRFYNLTLKVIWTDEVASIVYGLGNSFKDVPLNKIIDLATLLKPLEINDHHGLIDVLKYGFFEDFVPPLHFILLHTWILLFKTSDKLVSVFTARSLSVYLSIIAIPSMYWLAKSLFKTNRVVWLFSSLLITLSPYSIALAQDVRHYSLAIVFVILSLATFYYITEQVIYFNSLPIATICLLIGLNFLGIACHYFFIVVLISEVFALVILSLQYKFKLIVTKVFIVAFINLVTGLAWLPVYFLNDARNDLTAWLPDISKIDGLASLLLQPIVSSITMFFLLPVESSNVITIIMLDVIMLSTIFFVFLLIRESRNVLNIKRDQIHFFPIKFLTIYLSSSIIILIFICCFFKKNFLIAHRYHFVFFPALIILLSYFICRSFEDKYPYIKIKSMLIRRSLILSIFISIVFSSSLCVINNLSFLKASRADMMAEVINASFSHNTLIVTTHKTLNDTSNLIALGWQFIDDSHEKIAPRFLLDQSLNHDASDTTLQDILKTATHNTSLWLINYDGDIEIGNCSLKRNDTHINGYHYKYYYCLSSH
jgi:uncharacterized membrane protein